MGGLGPEGRKGSEQKKVILRGKQKKKFERHPHADWGKKAPWGGDLACRQKEGGMSKATTRPRGLEATANKQPNNWGGKGAVSNTSGKNQDKNSAQKRAGTGSPVT